MLDISGIVRIFEEIEQRLISSLKRNLMRHKREEKDEGFNWSAWQAEKLRGLERYRRENSAIMAEYTDRIDTATREIMEEQFAEGVNGSDIPPAVPVEEAPAEIRAEPQFFGVDRVKVDKLIEDVTAIEKSAESAALRMTDDVYRRTVNRVQLAMTTGSMPLQQAIDTAVGDFLDRGINCIVYKDGKRVNIADYVRMVLRTTATRAALQGKSAKYKALGYDTVVTSSYDMCSETCKPWQGHIYIDDTFTGWSGETRMQGDMLWGKSGYCGKWFPLLSEAIKRGLFHPNCRHSINLWRDGDPLPESVDNSDNERRYKLEQQQRALERAVRKAKRRAEGFTDPENVRKAKAEVREAQKALREFIDKVNADEGETVLRRDEGKEKVYEGEVEKPAPINDKPYTDVTQEYLDNATPGEGKYTVDEGCVGEHYESEKDFAKWVHETFGGDINVNVENQEEHGVPNPDYLWRGKLWDLKEPEKLTGANGRIRHGLHQIADNPGGVMLDLWKIDTVDYEELQKIIDRRMQWVHGVTVDIMIAYNRTLVKVLRYKK